MKEERGKGKEMKKNMPESRNGPRSVFSLLALPDRLRMVGLIQDGATCGAIAADPVIRDAYAARGAEFNRSALTRIRKSKEYAELAAMRQRKLAAVANDQLSAALLRDAGEAANVGEQAKVALLRAVSELSDLAEAADRIKALRSLSQTLGALDTATKDNRIADLSRKLEERKRQSAAAEAEWKLHEAELLSQIAELLQAVTELKAAMPGVKSSDVAQALKDKFGVK